MNISNLLFFMFSFFLLYMCSRSQGKIFNILQFPCRLLWRKMFIVSNERREAMEAEVRAAGRFRGAGQARAEHMPAQHRGKVDAREDTRASATFTSLSSHRPPSPDTPLHPLYNHKHQLMNSSFERFIDVLENNGFCT